MAPFVSYRGARHIVVMWFVAGDRRSSPKALDHRSMHFAGDLIYFLMQRRWLQNAVDRPLLSSAVRWS